MFTLNGEWQKATRSGSNGQCVEARFVNEHVEVRNSNHPDSGTTSFTRGEWATFLDAVGSDGEFQLP